jgi:hypothetical protein
MAKINITNEQVQKHEHQRPHTGRVRLGGVHQDTEPLTVRKISTSSDQVMGVKTTTASVKQLPSIDLLKLARAVKDSRDVFGDELRTIKHEYPAQESHLSPLEKKELADHIFHITTFCVDNQLFVILGVEILQMIGTQYAKYVLRQVKRVIGYTQRFDYAAIIDPVYSMMPDK